LAIKYLAGDRLIGTAAERAALLTEANPTYTPVLTSSSGWSEEGGSTYHSIDTSNNELDFRNKRNPAGDRSISYDLGATVSDTAWVMRFKLDIDVMNIPAGGAQMENISLTDSDSSVLFQTTSQDSLGFSIGWYSSASSERDFMALHGNNTNLQSNYTYIGTDIIVVGTWYVEIKRLTATSMSVRVTTSSDYTGGTLVTKTDVSASTDGLRYFKMAINNGADQANYMDGSISAIKIWNAVTTTDSYPNLPNGAILEESDTGKHYMWDGTDTWNEIT